MSAVHLDRRSIARATVMTNRLDEIRDDECIVNTADPIDTFSADEIRGMVMRQNTRAALAWSKYRVLHATPGHNFEATNEALVEAHREEEYWDHLNGALARALKRASNVESAS